MPGSGIGEAASLVSGATAKGTATPVDEEVTSSAASVSL
jgi:hypothetical protein